MLQVELQITDLKQKQKQTLAVAGSKNPQKPRDLVFARS